MGKKRVLVVKVGKNGREEDVGTIDEESAALLSGEDDVEVLRVLIVDEEKGGEFENHSRVHEFDEEEMEI